ncbi:hypothetical protein [Winogradskyella ouciana]|uniref:Uncharacterized protein n=1 Tax=Winogradskyella ouciana TaxID=2608631 RepID=A0A7K1G9N7_9FLAO|nr:hypothetical protein [Winogradskyella ouciana]MTE26006.1 hypothetical protein [Winogradskyella ouciana]
MFENINELIELNLTKISESPNRLIFMYELVDLKNNDLNDFNKMNKLAKAMQDRGLVDFINERLDLKEHGYEVYKSGGWIKFNNLQSEIEKSEIERTKYKGDLELKIKVLQRDSLEYQQTIRNLEENLKISSLLKNWWYLIAASIALGTAIGAYLF